MEDSANATTSQLPQILPKLKKGDAYDIAAKHAGLGSGETYEAAKKVVETRMHGLVDAIGWFKVKENVMQL